MFLYIVALCFAFGLGAILAVFTVRNLFSVGAPVSETPIRDEDVATKATTEIANATKTKTAEVELPKELFPSLVTSGSGTSEDTVTGMNLLAQFLFRDLRFSQVLHQAIIQRINEEIEDQLSSTRAGKLVHKITIHDYDLGNTIPLLKKMEVLRSEIEPIKKTVEMVELLVGVQYSGAFNLSLDVETAIISTTRLSLSVSGLEGEGQLSFNRSPYSHWSFAFVKPPVVDMEVKSTIQGATFTQVTTLVAALVSKILQRKHVLPDYRIRYKPFFDPPEISLHEYPKVAPPVPVGFLSVTVKECSRLLESLLEDGLHCTLAAGMNAFVSAGPSKNSSSYVMTLKVARKKNHPFGVIFKPLESADSGTAEEVPAVVAAVTPGSPAHAAGVLQSDLITHVDGVATPTVRSAAAAVIGAGERFMLTLERKGKIHISVSDLEKYIQIETPVIQLGVETPKQEMPPVAEPVDVMPFQNAEPTVELPATAPGIAEIKKTTNVESAAGELPTSPANFELAAEAKPFRTISKDLHLKRTTTLVANPNLSFNETIRLEIRPGDLYFNFALWTLRKKDPGNDKLLGHISVPLAEITSECEGTGLSHYVTTFQLCPPDVEGKEAMDHPLSSHQGFDPRLCYGDVLFSFFYSATEEQPISDVTIMTDEGKSVTATEYAHQLVEGSKHILESTRLGSKDHTFIMTLLHGTIFCDYCASRIWLRDAAQCLTCGMVCHRKCREKCTRTVCQPMRQRDMGHLTLKKDVKDDMKIPFSIDDVEALIEDNPFLPTEDEEGDELNAAVHRLLASERNEKMTRLAKETAKESYDHLPIQERKEKLLSMVSNLRKAIEGEENQRAMLAGQSELEGVSIEVRRRLAHQMSRSEEKTKALALLLLHYSSALEYVAGLEEAMKLEAQKTMESTVTSDLVA